MSTPAVVAHKPAPPAGRRMKPRRQTQNRRSVAPKPPKPTAKPTASRRHTLAISPGDAPAIPKRRSIGSVQRQLSGRASRPSRDLSQTMTRNKKLSQAERQLSKAVAEIRPVGMSPTSATLYNALTAIEPAALEPREAKRLSISLVEAQQALDLTDPIQAAIAREVDALLADIGSDPSVSLATVTDSSLGDDDDDDDDDVDGDGPMAVRFPPDLNPVSNVDTATPTELQLLAALEAVTAESGNAPPMAIGSDGKPMSAQARIMQLLASVNGSLESAEASADGDELADELAAELADALMGIMDGDAGPKIPSPAAAVAMTSARVADNRAMRADVKAEVMRVMRRIEVNDLRRAVVKLDHSTLERARSIHSARHAFPLPPPVFADEGAPAGRTALASSAEATYGSSISSVDASAEESSYASLTPASRPLSMSVSVPAEVGSAPAASAGSSGHHTPRRRAATASPLSSICEVEDPAADGSTDRSSVSTSSSSTSSSWRRNGGDAAGRPISLCEAGELTREGWLEKKCGMIHKSWNARFVRVSFWQVDGADDGPAELCLMYRKKALSGKWARVISLRGCAVASTSRNGRHFFTLTTPAGSRLSFSGSSAAEVRTWLVTFRRAIRFADAMGASIDQGGDAPILPATA